METTTINLERPEAAPLLVSFPEAQRLLGGISRATLYNRINDGLLEKVNLAGRALITMRSINALMARLLGEAA